MFPAATKSPPLGGRPAAKGRREPPHADDSLLIYTEGVREEVERILGDVKQYLLDCCTGRFGEVHVVFHQGRCFEIRKLKKDRLEGAAAEIAAQIAALQQTPCGELKLATDANARVTEAQRTVRRRY